jgi:hypothetical protein
MGLWIRRSVCDEFTHCLKSSIRGNDSLVPRSGAFFGRPKGIVKLSVLFGLASFTPYEQLVELILDERRQKILHRNCLARRFAVRIVQLAKEMIRFLGQINRILDKCNFRRPQCACSVHESLIGPKSY